MDFKVLIADSAIADLKQIVEFVAEDNPEAAVRLGDFCSKHSSFLARSTTPDPKFPHSKKRF
jgi:hypothetical protein